MSAYAKLLLTMALSIFVFNEAAAGPHLGIKLAALKFSQAWEAKDKNLLYRVSTPELAYLFSQTSVPNFEIPEGRICTDKRGVGLFTRKSRGCGTLIITNREQRVRVSLVGRGFKWRVSDVHVTKNGHTYSLKTGLDMKIKWEQFLKSFVKKSKIKNN